MSLTTPKDASAWIRENYSKEYYEMLIRDACYAMYGVDQRSYNLSDVRSHNMYDGEEDIPGYIDVVPNNARVGISRRFLTDCFMALNVHMGVRPKPLCIGLDSITNALRASAYESRYEGIGLPSTAGEWSPAKTRAFQDIFLLGMGGVQLGVRETKDGLFYLTQQYVPAHQIIVDRFAVPYQSGRAVATVHYVSPAYARAMFGNNLEEQHITQVAMGEDKGYPVVRIVNYCDVGLDGKEPTRIVWLGGLDQQPAYHDYNSYECLDVAIGEHYRPPAISRPFGRVRVSAGTMSLRNSIERHVLNFIDQGGDLAILNQKYVDTNAIKDAIATGNRFVFSKEVGLPKDERIIELIQREQLSPEVLEWLRYFDMVDDMESNTTDMDNGLAVRGTQSATEISLLAERSDRRNAYLSRQIRDWFSRHAHVAFQIMRAADTHPCQVSVSIDGRDVPMLLNDPDNPSMDMSLIFGEQHRIVMDEQAMTAEDLSRAKARKLDDLNQLLASGLVGMEDGMVSVKWMVTQMLEAMGVKDIDAAIVHLEQMPAMDPTQMPMGDPMAMMDGGFPAQMGGQAPGGMQMPPDPMAVASM